MFFTCKESFVSNPSMDSGLSVGYDPVPVLYPGLHAAMCPLHGTGTGTECSGYQVYYGLSSRNYFAIFDVGTRRRMS